MARIIVELTNRCNLRCRHCYEERHAATADLPLEILDKVLQEGHGCGIDHIDFTGGEPTIHRRFAEIIQRVCEAAYTFGFVSNGINFPKIYPPLRKHRRSFKGVTFSLDGAIPETHDRLRDKGSYRRVIQAASVCVFRDLPFTLNMVITAQNRGEIPETVELAERLGSRAVRFGHLMVTPETAGLNLTPGERCEVEAQIWQLQRQSDFPVYMAPGHFSESPYFPCGPLGLEEYNLDYRGNLTLCCQLSGYGGKNDGRDVMGNLSHISLSYGISRFREEVARYIAEKRERVNRREFTELDHFPCWYCVKYLGKVPSYEHFPLPEWSDRTPSNRMRSIRVCVEPKVSTAS